MFEFQFTFIQENLWKITVGVLSVVNSSTLGFDRLLRVRISILDASYISICNLPIPFYQECLMNHLRTALSLFGVLVTVCLAGAPIKKSPVPVEDFQLSAKAVIAVGEERLRGRSSQARMKMSIVRPSYTRDLTLRSWAQGEDKALVEILEPAKETGVASLRVENQMWNYLPKTDQVVRVPTSLMLQSWMGSDFTNDDLMKASSLSRDYSHRVLKLQTVRNEKVVLIECLPLPNAPVVWGKIHHWARLADSLPIHQKFYDESGKLIRTIDFSHFRKMDDRVIPSQMKVTKMDGSKETTTVTYERVFFNHKIPEAVFSREEIRHMSQKGKVITAGWFINPRHQGRR